MYVVAYGVIAVCGVCGVYITVLVVYIYIYCCVCGLYIDVCISVDVTVQHVH